MKRREECITQAEELNRHSKGGMGLQPKTASQVKRKLGEGYDFTGSGDGSISLIIFLLRLCSLLPPAISLALRAIMSTVHDSNVLVAPRNAGAHHHSSPTQTARSVISLFLLPSLPASFGFGKISQFFCISLSRCFGNPPLQKFMIEFHLQFILFLFFSFFVHSFSSFHSRRASCVVGGMSAHHDSKRELSQSSPHQLDARRRRDRCFCSRRRLSTDDGTF